MITESRADLAGGITLDSSANIYVTNNTYVSLVGGTSGAVGSITVYSARNLMPIATISGSNTALADPRGVAIGPTAGPSR